jgi:N-acetylglucosaminyldiphosphoundecaprenol N-acetyl-beta-D-mannosaminyltransferase
MQSIKGGRAMRNSIELLGFGVHRLSADDCVDEIVDAMEVNDDPKWLACINPHSYVQTHHDREFDTALRAADWLIPDGVGIVLAAMVLRTPIWGRVTGSDIFWRLHAALERQGNRSVFFLGATEATLTKIRERMQRDYPNVRIAGCYAPPFRHSFTDDEVQAMITAVNDAMPDVLWVGMTAPKQEKWISENLPLLKVKFIGAVGAVFDFYSGRVKRSHPVFQRFGLEWLPRLVQQPRRLWRRMVVSAPIFAWHVFLTAMRAK